MKLKQPEVNNDLDIESQGKINIISLVMEGLKSGRIERVKLGKFNVDDFIVDENVVLDAEEVEMLAGLKGSKSIMNEFLPE